MPTDRDTVLGRAVGILRVFGVDDTVLPLSELVRRTGLPKGTAHLLEAGRRGLVGGQEDMIVDIASSAAAG